MKTDMAAGGLERWLPASGAELPGAELEWLSATRQRALERARSEGLPSAKSEAWRYTGLKGLLEKGFVPHEGPLTALGREDIAEILIPGLDSHRIVLVNGRYTAGLSELGDLPSGVRVGSLRQLLKDDPDALRAHLTRVADVGAHVFSQLNTAGIDDGLVVLLEPGTRLDRPIELIHLSVGMETPRVAQPRHLIVLDQGAQAVLIERYLGLGEALYCTNSLAEVSLGPEAVLSHQRVQLESRGAFHITGLYLSQAAGSRYAGVNVGLGASWARTDLVSRFCGQDAECKFEGLYLAGDGQLIDYHLDVEHGLPKCTSRERFKGILYGQGRAVFDGLVRVAVDAQQTDAQMVNNNLLLSKKAEVDTKPQLEIYADDVKCSHGTTVGQLEPERLFYLRARGIPAGIARRILCLGFAEEVIGELAPAALREHVSEQVGRRLEAAPID